jgi:hypothetical protein
METLNRDKLPDLVANIEVMQILEDQIAARASKRGNKLRQRDWIEEGVLRYLKTTPCIEADPDKMPQLVKRLRDKKEGFGLTHAEALQVINFMPRESVENHLMIEELQTRMSDDKQEELLKAIGTGLFNGEDEEELEKEEELEEPVEEDFGLLNGGDNDAVHDQSNGSNHTGTPIKKEPR